MFIIIYMSKSKKSNINTNKNTIKIVINNETKKRKRKSKKQVAKSKHHTQFGQPVQPASQGLIASGLIPRIIPRGISIGSTGLADDYSALAREYNNPVKVLPKDVETPVTTVSKPQPTLVKQLRDATATEKKDLMALSLPHLRTAIKDHDPTFLNSRLRLINLKNKEIFIDDIFGFPPSRPVAGEAKKRFDDSESEDETIPVHVSFQTPRFQGHKPPSASTETFTGGEGMSSGLGMGQLSKSREEEEQDAYFASLPQDVQNIFHGADERDDFVYSPPPSPHQPPPKQEPKDSKKQFKERLASRQEEKEQGLDPNVSIRPQQFDISLSTMRRDPFEDATASAGASPFLDEKATSVPVVRPKLSVGFQDVVNKKKKEKKEEQVHGKVDAKAESHNDLLLSATKSSSKATPPRHTDNNPTTPSQDGRPLKMPHQFPLDDPFNIPVINDSVPFSPTRNSTRRGISLIPGPTSEAPRRGRPTGSKNKLPHQGEVFG